MRHPLSFPSEQTGLTLRAGLASWARCVLAMVLAVPWLPAGAAMARDMQSRPVVILGGLDKVTARVSTFPVAVGKTAQFGTLVITSRACLESSPLEPPESSAYLEIQDVKPNQDPETVFRGWMFASSPALSALEHAVYDVWVTGCQEPQDAPAQ